MELAQQQALQSKHDIFKHGCVLTHRNKIVAMGHNTMRFHAEIYTFNQIDLKRYRNRNFTVYVARINRNSDARMSKPCKNCQSFLKKVNINNVFFSTDNGLEKMNLCSIISE